MQTNTSSAARQTNTRKIAFLAMFCALALLSVTLIRIPVVLFLKYEPKDVIITFAGFLFGPLSAALVSFVVSLVEMLTISDNGIIGFLMNVLASCAFACPAALIYKKKQTVTGAVVGLVSGTLLMTLVMIAWNYFITPFYMGVERADVAVLLVPAFLPFNLLKGGLNAALTMLLYKPLVQALRRANLLPERESAQSGTATGKLNIGVALVSAFLLVSCILLILVLRGVI